MPSRLDAAQRASPLARETFRLARPQPARARPALVRAGERLKPLIHVEGDVQLARTQRAAGDVAGAALPGTRRCRLATLLFQTRKVGSIYQQQSDPVFDAAIRAGRLRFDGGEIFPRSDARRRWSVRSAAATPSSTCPTWISASATPAFVPFFGMQAATLLAPSRMARALNMIVQPVVAEAAAGRRRLQGALPRAVDRFPDRRPAGRCPHDESPGSRPRSAATRRSICGCTSGSRRGPPARRPSIDSSLSPGERVGVRGGANHGGCHSLPLTPALFPEGRGSCSAMHGKRVERLLRR